MFLDDRDSGWKPSCDDNGKIFINARAWHCSDMRDTKLTYEEAEQFLRFVEKYVIRAVGVHFLLQWSKLHRSKTILEKVTASDIAYTMLVYENSSEVWEEELMIKENAATEEVRCTMIREKNQIIMEEGGNECGCLVMDGLIVDTSITGNCLEFFKA